MNCATRCGVCKYNRPGNTCDAFPDGIPAEWQAYLQEFLPAFRPDGTPTGHMPLMGEWKDFCKAVWEHMSNQ